MARFSKGNVVIWHLMSVRRALAVLGKVSGLLMYSS